MGSRQEFTCDRRRLLRGAGAGLAACLLASVTDRVRAAGAVAVTPLAEGLNLLSGTGANVLALATGAGLAVIDSGAAADRDDLLVTLDELADGRIAALFNTHWHPDQVGANALLGSRGVAIHAHVKTAQRLRAGYYVPAEDRYVAPLPASAVPTQSFYVDNSVTIGERRLDCSYLIAAHTDGDICVALPELNVIAIGDVVTAGDPVFDWYGGGWLGGRVDALARLVDMGDAGTRYVPSHGPVLTRADLEREHGIMLELFERIVEHIRLGETPENMLEEGVLDGLGRDFDDRAKLLYDLQKGFWGNHNKLMHDIV